MKDITKEIAEDRGYDVFDYDDIESLYEELLNELYPSVDVCGFPYDGGYLLKLVDETAFRCGCSDWSSEEFEELGDGYYMRKDDYESLVAELEDEEDTEDEDEEA